MVGLGSIPLSAGPTCNLNGIARFVEFQRHVPIQSHGLDLGRVHVENVLPPLQQFVLRVDLFNSPGRIFPDHVFHHHDIAGLCHREIRFRRHDHGERLQLGRHVQLALGSVQQDFAEVGCAAFRGDGPQHVREVLGPVCSGGLQSVKFHFDFDVALFALHFGLAAGLRQQEGALGNRSLWLHCGDCN